MSTPPDDRLPPPTSPAATGLSAALGATVAVLTGWTAIVLLPAAAEQQGEEALMTLLLGTIAAAGAVLCAYLTVIWALACLALLSGPATRSSTAAVAALRVLAPRLARRVALSAALATTAAGLVVGPASASTLPDSSPAPDQHTAAASAVLHPTAPAPAQPEDDAAASDGGGQEPAPQTPPAEDAPADPETPPAPEDPELPSLSWGESPAEPAEMEPAPPAAGTSPAPQTESAPDSPPGSGSSAPPGSGSSAPTGSSSPSGESSPGAGGSDSEPQEVAPRTITVATGDTLWSLTDELLGPGPDSVAEISATWPLLYEANRDTIGSHPDQIAPGQVLIVPSTVTTQEQS